MPRIRSNGLHIEIDDHGSGPAVLLIMGIGAQMTLWPMGLVDFLVDHGYRVIRMDNRDAGLSDHLEHLGAPKLPARIARRLLGLRVSAPYTLEDMAADAVGVLDALDIEQAHIVGASMGGMISQVIALDHTPRVASLTSIMSAAGRLRDSRPTPKALLALLERPLEDTVDCYEKMTIDFFRLVGGSKYDIDEAFLRDYARTAYSRGRTGDAGFARQAAAIVASPDRTKRLARLQLPTLVVHGAEDPLTPCSGGRAMAKVMPNARYLELEGVGHSLPSPIHDQIATAMVEMFRSADESTTQAVAAG